VARWLPAARRLEEAAAAPGARRADGWRGRRHEGGWHGRRHEAGGTGGELAAQAASGDGAGMDGDGEHGGGAGSGERRRRGAGMAQGGGGPTRGRCGDGARRRRLARGGRRRSKLGGIDDPSTATLAALCAPPPPCRPAARRLVEHARWPGHRWRLGWGTTSQQVHARPPLLPLQGGQKQLRQGDGKEASRSLASSATAGGARTGDRRLVENARETAACRYTI
jgi:hypothetical protein